MVLVEDEIVLLFVVRIFSSNENTGNKDVIKLLSIYPAPPGRGPQLQLLLPVGMWWTSGSSYHLCWDKTLAPLRTDSDQTLENLFHEKPATKTIRPNFKPFARWMITNGV